MLQSSQNAIRNEIWARRNDVTKRFQKPVKLNDIDFESHFLLL